MKHIVTGLILIFAGAALFSCQDNDLEERRQAELQKLNNYIEENYPDLEPTASGLYFIELEEGTGDSIQVNDRVQFFFDMWTLDTLTVAQSGRYEPLEVNVLPPSQLGSSAQSIEQMLGLHEALSYMKKGSKARLILPSQLAFGQYGNYSVGGFTSLIMEVEVYKVYPFEADDEEEVVE